jgi:hypothetical protein
VIFPIFGEKIGAFPNVNQWYICMIKFLQKIAVHMWFEPKKPIFLPNVSAKLFQKSQLWSLEFL